MSMRRHTHRPSLDKPLSTVIIWNRLAPGGLAFHPDGSALIAVNRTLGDGVVQAVQPNGNGLQTVAPGLVGYLFEDRLFDT